MPVSLPTLELVENEVSAPQVLSAAEIAALKQLLRSASVLASTTAPGAVEINPGSVAGVGEIDGRQVVVAPKFDVRRLLFLVSYSISPTRWQELLAAFGRAPDLRESIVPGFAEAALRATERGLLRSYVTKEEPLSTVRGRIDFNELAARRFGLAPPIDCRYDEYSQDIEENRLLLAATERLLGLRRLGPELQRRLRVVRSSLGEVTRRRYAPSAVPRITHTRLTEHYRPAVELARLVLQGFSIEVGRRAPVVSRGFFLDTARLFEDFVVKALREALGLSESAFPQGARGRRVFLDFGEDIGLEPDLSWWRGDRCVFVGDAKYKATPERTGVKNHDVYQLLAYLQATGLSSGMLVYAKGEARERTYSIQRSSKRIEVRTLDLDVEPVTLLARIEELAGEIASLAGGPQSLPG